MNRQCLHRTNGENRAERAKLQLLCAVSLWRTAATLIVPEYGASAWWMALLCLLPGIAAALLLRAGMALCGASTVTEALRVCLGRAGAAVFSLMLASLLLTEAVSSLTALLVVFTQGVGTRGTQFTLAVLTGAVMLFTFHREGLPRAVYLLRWGMAGAAVLLAAFALGEARLDHLFPLAGGSVEIRRLPLSLAWTVTLLLTLSPGERRGRLCSAVCPCTGAVAALLVTTLVIPHGLLLRRMELADALLQPAWVLPNALRVLWLCLLMLTFFLAIAASVQMATQQLCAPFAKAPEWLPHGVLICVVLTQAAEPRRLWAVLSAVQPWLLLPLAGTALVLLPIALIRRKRP